MLTPEQLKYMLSLWEDTRQECITREQAGEIADNMEDFISSFPAQVSEEFIEGWEAACNALSGALRFKDWHG